MKFGSILPTMGSGVSPAGILAAAQTAERLGWSSVWTTDHVLVGPGERGAVYRSIYEALTTLAWLGGATSRIRLGTSVIVVPQRSAVILAKELATIDALTGGRLEVGVGVGWSEEEFANLGVADRFHVRGAYLDEAISLWRHLWSGSREPFEGRFHTIRDGFFGPLPTQGANVPIVVGGRSEAALRRAGRLGDGYQSTGLGPDGFAERLARLGEIAREAGRPTPSAGARIAVRFSPSSGVPSLLAGDTDALRRGLAAWEAAGADELAIDFGERDPERASAAIERFQREVIAA